MLDDDAHILVAAVRRLAATSDLEAIQRIVRTAARELADADGATFVLRDGEFCHYADEDAIGPLWKGQRFPLESCISGWAMLHRRSVAIPDIYTDDRIPHDAYRPTFVRSLLMTPIRGADPVGAIGVYWAREHVPTVEESELLQALADSTALAIDSLIVRRKMVEHAARADAVAREARTDELTGSLNRRGFRHAAAEELADARARSEPSIVGFFDIDGLKHVNDTYGHRLGSELVRMAAGALTDAFGDLGVVARKGGDEFGVLLAGCAHAEADLRARLTRAVAAVNGRRDDGLALRLSAGFVHSPADDDRDLAALVEAADAAMYAEKRRAYATAG